MVCGVAVIDRKSELQAEFAPSSLLSKDLDAARKILFSGRSTTPEKETAAQVYWVRIRQLSNVLAKASEKDPELRKTLQRWHDQMPRIFKAKSK